MTRRSRLQTRSPKQLTVWLLRLIVQLEPLDTTELGRYPSARLAEAIRIRAGTCQFPTCTVPADRCDLDHHEPVPRGATSGSNLDPFCRRHHRGKTSCTMTASPLRRLQELATGLPLQRSGYDRERRRRRIWRAARQSATDFAWHAALRDQDGVDWTLPTAERYRCVDEPLPTGLAFNR
jgi:hypothetical protein